MPGQLANNPFLHGFLWGFLWGRQTDSRFAGPVAVLQKVVRVMLRFSAGGECSAAEPDVCAADDQQQPVKAP